MNQLPLFIDETDIESKQQLVTTAPQDFDYKKSVKKVKRNILKWKNLTIDIVNELYIAREILSSQGKRTDLTSGKSSRSSTPILPSWEEYCHDTGLNKRTVNKWLEKYDPKNLKIKEPEPKSAPSSNPKTSPAPAPKSSTPSSIQVSSQTPEPQDVAPTKPSEKMFFFVPPWVTYEKGFLKGLPEWNKPISVFFTFNFNGIIPEAVNNYYSGLQYYSFTETDIKKLKTVRRFIGSEEAFFIQISQDSFYAGDWWSLFSTKTEGKYPEMFMAGVLLEIINSFKYENLRIGFMEFKKDIDKRNKKAYKKTLVTQITLDERLEFNLFGQQKIEHFWSFKKSISEIKIQQDTKVEFDRNKMIAALRFIEDDMIAYYTKNDWHPIELLIKNEGEIILRPIMTNLRKIISERTVPLHSCNKKLIKKKIWIDIISVVKALRVIGSESVNLELDPEDENPEKFCFSDNETFFGMLNASKKYPVDSE